jgi:hypothetical protein
LDANCAVASARCRFSFGQPPLALIPIGLGLF